MPAPSFHLRNRISLHTGPCSHNSRCSSKLSQHRTRTRKAAASAPPAKLGQGFLNLLVKVARVVDVQVMVGVRDERHPDRRAAARLDRLYRLRHCRDVVQIVGTVEKSRRRQRGEALAALGRDGASRVEDAIARARVVGADVGGTVTGARVGMVGARGEPTPRPAFSRAVQ